MKNSIRFRFICFALLTFAAFSLSACRDLFHPDPGLGILRIVNTGYPRITNITICRWDSSKIIASDNNSIYEYSSREFSLGAGDYQVFIDDSFGRDKVGSVRITITKDETKVVLYNADTGVYTYP